MMAKSMICDECGAVMNRIIHPYPVVEWRCNHCGSFFRTKLDVSIIKPYLEIYERKGTLQYYQILAKCYEDIVDVQINYDNPGVLNIICKEDYDIDKVLEFINKEVDYSLDCEICTVSEYYSLSDEQQKFLRWMGKALEYME